jgi:outer membrane immunogenic protein
MICSPLQFWSGGEKMKKLLALVVLAASVGSASAADMPQAQPYTRAPVVVPPAVYDWSGFYLGAMGGYGWSDRVTVGGFAVTNPDINGGFGGGTLGFNYQVPGTMFVLGAETDAAWSDIQHTVGIAGIASAQERIMSFGSVTGRAGVAINNVLLYGKGGYGWADNRAGRVRLRCRTFASHRQFFGVFLS